MNAERLNATGFDWLYIEEPYGHVKLTDCRFEVRQRTRWNFNTQSSVPDGEATFVIGTVVESSWCGALLCGVPIAKPTERYPVGSTFEFRIRCESDLATNTTRYIAM